MAQRRSEKREREKRTGIKYNDWDDAAVAGVVVARVKSSGKCWKVCSTIRYIFFCHRLMLSALRVCNNAQCYYLLERSVFSPRGNRVFDKIWKKNELYFCMWRKWHHYSQSASYIAAVQWFRLYYYYFCYHKRIQNVGINAGLLHFFDRIQLCAIAHRKLYI